MINVIYIVNETVPGGAAQSLLNMLEGLDGYINPILIIPGRGLLERWLRQKGIEYFIVPFVNGFGKIGSHTNGDIDYNYLDNYEAALQIKKIAEEKKVGLIHSNSSVSNVGAMTAIMSKLPHVWHLRELGEEDYGCEFWDKKLKCKLLSYADFVITISETVKDSYLEKCGIDSICLYDGIDTKKYFIKIDERPLNKCFLLAGEIIPSKGQLEAVKAAEVLITAGESVRLVLAGSGDKQFVWILKRYIESKGLKRYIEILPFQNNLAVLRHKSDFAITASRKEALGRVTLEAMLAGNIVVGADTGGTLELIGSNQSRGYLYRQGDYIDLARAMRRALYEAENFPGNIRRMRKRAQKFVMQKCNTEYYAKRILSLYRMAEKKHSEKDLESLNYMSGYLKKRYEYLIAKGIEPKKDKFFSGERLLEKKIEQWEKLKMQGCAISVCLEERKITNVAIYGMAYLGCRLYDELEKRGVKVAYVMDRNPGFLKEIFNVYQLEDDLPDVEAIIVTVLREEEKIKDDLRRRCKYQIYGISQLLDFSEGLSEGK